jgi:FAD-linked sulfhydryl oxidase
MGTKLWGPDTWYVIHVIADSAPDAFTSKETREYSDFYRALSQVIPCPSCALHFQEFIQRDPPTFKTRMDALLWTVRAHNHANKNTDKPILTEEEGLRAIQAEIEARNSGSVRGRRPTYIESITDNSVPFTIGIVLGVIIAFLLHR